MHGIAALNLRLAALADEAWPQRDSDVGRECERFAPAAACMAVRLGLGTRRRFVADSAFVVLAMALSDAAPPPPTLARLAAAVMLQHRANLLHARGGWLWTHDAARRAQAVLVGDCCLSGALRCLVSLGSLPLLELFADASLRSAEDNAAALPRTAPAGTFLHRALARGVARLGLSALGEMDCDRIGEAFAHASAALERPRFDDAALFQRSIDALRDLPGDGARLLHEAAGAFSAAWSARSRNPSMASGSC